MSFLLGLSIGFLLGIFVGVWFTVSAHNDAMGR